MALHLYLVAGAVANPRVHRRHGGISVPPYHGARGTFRPDIQFGRGRSAENPLATLEELIHELNLFTFHALSDDIIVHIASGTYTWEGTLGPLHLRSSVFLIGDGADQAGDDGFTELIAPAPAGGGSTDSVVVSAGGLVVDAYRGKTIEILDGAAAGDRRTIRNNTATDFVPVAKFSASVLGASYRIVEPAVEFQLAGVPSSSAPNDSTICEVGTRGDFASQWRNTTPGYSLHLCNLRLAGVDTTSPTKMVTWSIYGASVVLFGVELVERTAQYISFNACSRSLVRSGVDWMQFGAAASEPYSVGLAPNLTAWAGWGFSEQSISPRAAAYQIHHFTGYIVAPGTNLFIEAGRWWILGGHLYEGPSAGFCTLSARHGAELTLGDWLPNNPDLPVLVTHLGATDVAIGCLKASDGGRITVLHARLEKTNRGIAVQAVGAGDHDGNAPGVVSLAGDSGLVTIVGITGTEAPTWGLVARGGGRISWMDGYVSISGTFPATQQAAVFTARISTGNPAAQQDFSAFAADGDFIAAGDGSVIQRF